MKEKTKTVKEFVSEQKTQLNKKSAALSEVNSKFNQVSDYRELPIKDFSKMIVNSSCSKQAAACQFEHYIEYHGNEKISPHEARGDFKDKNGKYFELKQSFTGNKFNGININDIRPWQNLDYYFIIYTDVDTCSNKCFKLSRKQMDKELSLGSCNTHGLPNVNGENSEKSLRLGKDRIAEWEKKYASDFNAIIA